MRTGSMKIDPDRKCRYKTVKPAPEQVLCKKVACQLAVLPIPKSLRARR